MKIDMHVHSWFSKDGIYPPKIILKYAKMKGLKGIAIADHNTIRGSKNALKERIPGIIVIPAVELSICGGHLLIYGVTREIRTIKDAVKEGGLIIVAHPYDVLRHGRPLINLAHGIEIFNSSAFPLANYLALIKQRELNVPFTAGSDAHILESIGNAGIIINEEIESWEELIEEIRKKKINVYGKYNSPFQRAKKVGLNLKRRFTSKFVPIKR